MKRIYYLTSMLIILLVSCKDAEETKPEKKDSPTIETTQNDIESAKIDTTKLLIEGTDIWVRSEPFTGEVVMKLNTGDECKIIDKGEIIQVRDMKDRWYNIEFEGKTGWVYGSQTNLKTGETIDIKDFEQFLGEFIPVYKDNSKDLKPFIQEMIGHTVLNNPGAFCGAFAGSKERLFPKSITSSDIYNKEPKGDFCEGYPGVKSGIYYQKIKIEKLPKFVSEFGEDGEIITSSFEIPLQFANNTIYRVQIISDEYHFAYMYFINVGKDWYLIGVNNCDCSA